MSRGIFVKLSNFSWIKHQSTKMYSSTTLLSVLLLLLASQAAGQLFRGATPSDVVWYISPGGSTNISTCGRSIDDPCDNIELILNLSPLFEDSNATCRTSPGDNDGRSSTTLYLLNGVHSIPIVCIRNWTNLSIIGLGSNVFVTGRQPGGLLGVFNLMECRNLTIRNLNYQASFPGVASMYIQSSRDVTLSGVSVAVTQAHSKGVLMEECYGDIFINDAIFFSNPENIDTDMDLFGLSIRFGCDSSRVHQCDSVYPPATLTIRNATFKDFVNNNALTNQADSYGNTKNQGNALRILFYIGSVDSEVLIDDILVTDNFSPAASSVIIDYDTGSNNNSVRITGSMFKNNYVRYGGGLAVYFYNSNNNLLEVEDCVFEENQATFEGGGMFVGLLNNTGNVVRISRSTFTRNTALFGAGLYLFNSPIFFTQRGLFDPLFVSALVEGYLSDCRFVSNMASLKEGVVNALRMNLNISGETIFANNTGSSLLLRASMAKVYDNITFFDNKAETGGAINMRQGSRVDMTGVDNGLFAHNKATFAGGAIYADSASTTQLSSEYNHTIAQSSNLVSCFIQFGFEISTPEFQTQTRFIFRGNTAVSEGRHIHAFSLRGCVIGNFVPAPTASFFRIQVGNTTHFDDNELLDSTSTGPSYLFFYGASTRCLKTVNSVTYLLPNCSHELINETFYLNQDLQCALGALVKGEFNSDFRLSTALPPTLNRLIIPWAGIDTSWTKEPGTKRLSCSETNPGDLNLSPAPGEQFDLTIQLADQLLNIVSATIYMEVMHELDYPPGVLIQLNGLQYSYRDRVYFTPNRALSGVALVGVPGTVGKLRIVADSQILGDSVELLIPFKLAQCPEGYYDPPGAQTIDEVNALLNTTFLMTQRIPTEQPLACQCFSSSNLPFKFSSGILNLAHRCIDGYTIQLNSILWAGRIQTKDSGSQLARYPSTVPCPDIPIDATPVSDRLSRYFEMLLEDEANTTRGNFDPVDVVPYDGGVIPGGGAPVLCFNYSVPDLIDFKPQGEFSIEYCTRGYCRGNSRSNWFVVDVDYPCVANRMGPLCGQCVPGHAVTMYSTTCHNCTSQVYHPYVAAVLTVFGGLILVVFVVALNFGASPTLDSLLFFIQGTMIILSGRTDYEVFKWLAFFNPDFTVNLCITPHLDGFTRLALQYVTPLYILLLLSIVLVLTCIKGCSRFLGKHSFLHGLWLLILISYLNIANTTFELLHCKGVGPEGDRSIVLVHDASVMCYNGAHLAFAIIAIVIAVTFVLPFPILLILIMYIPKYKPITDVYCSPYKDHVRWWVLISLYRRLFLVLVGVFIQNFVSRHFGFLIAVAIILIMYVVSWPYNQKFDNYFGMGVTWMLLVVTIVTQPDLYLLVDPRRAVSTTLVVLTIAVGIGLLIWEIVLVLCYKKKKGATLSEYYDEHMKPSLGHVRKNVSSKLTRLRMLKEKLDDDSRQNELVESTQSSIVPRNATVDATTYREPLLDSLYSGGSLSINDSMGSSIKPLTPGRKVKRTLFGRKGKKDMSIPEEGDGWRGQEGAPTVTVVSPDRNTGYSDSGFATTYTNRSATQEDQYDQETL